MRDTGTDDTAGGLTVRTAATRWRLDPLGTQSGGHLRVDRVSIVRIACVAAETGARMQRDGLAVDPLGWMVAPLELFGGLAPIEACMDRDACARAVLLHGLGLDPATGPDVFEHLIHDEDREAEEVGHD